MWASLGIHWASKMWYIWSVFRGQYYGFMKSCLGHLATERPYTILETLNTTTLLERKIIMGVLWASLERKKLLWRVLENEEESLE